MRIKLFLVQTCLPILTFLFIWTPAVQAQLYYFNHFQVEQGLSNNAVLSSAQDKNGFMWFGTRDGLNRFDGYNFKHFYADTDNENGLGSNYIHSIAINRHNLIWIGTDQGVYIFDPKTEQFNPLKEMVNREILRIEEDPEGNMWFIANNELFCYLIAEKKIIQKTHIRQYQVSGFCFDNHNQVWIGDGKNLICLTNNTSYPLPIQSPLPTEIKRLYTDRQHNIWIGTSKEGLFHYNHKNHQIRQVIASNRNSPLYIRDILQVNDTAVWVASESGLYICDQLGTKYNLLKREKDNPWSLADNAIYTLSKDHQDGLWVGSYFGGIHYFHPQHTYFQKIFPRATTNSLQGHAIREIVEDHQHNLWIGTEDNGLTFWDYRNNQFSTLNQDTQLAHSNIHGLAIAGDSLLVGTFHQGMDVVNVKTKKIIKHFNNKNTNGKLGDNFVFSIYRTRAGRILLGTSRGVYEFFPGKDEFQLLKPLKRHIFHTSIYEDRAGNIWFTTWRDGLFKLTPSTGDLVRFTHDIKDPQSLNSNRATRVFQDSKGTIWVATENGIAIWNPITDKFHRITKKDGLPSNLILGFEEDDNENLWISTSRGLVKMDIHRNHIELFDTELGLLDLQFNYNSVFKDAKGYLYFGSSRGLIRFKPELMSDHFKSNSLAPLYITGIQTHQRELTIGGKEGNLSQAVIYTNQLELNHDESTISLDFAALNFVSAKSTSYRYRLVGLDSSWTILRNHSKAYFTKVPPGNYTFEVVATDANGVPISEQKALQITINPPLWASTPAFITYIILAAAFICYAIYSYDSRIKEKNRRRLAIIKTHNEEELYKAKMDFFMRITHDIKTPLTLIKGPLEWILNGTDKENTNKWLHTIHQNTEKLITLTDNLLDFKKIESNDFALQLQFENISKLVEICIQEFKPLIENKKIDIQIDLDEQINANIDIETIYKIISNLLHNAVKYADKVIIISLYQVPKDEIFCIAVKNDGALLTQEEIQQIFKPFQRASSHYRIKGSGLGLALTHSFATLHGGSLQYVQNEERLNIFLLQIPL